MYKIKRFARKDYEGLDEIGRDSLKKGRDNLAKKLSKGRKRSLKIALDKNKSPNEFKGFLKDRNHLYNSELEKSNNYKSKLKSSVLDDLSRRKTHKIMKNAKYALGAAIISGGVYSAKKLHDKKTKDK